MATARLGVRAARVGVTQCIFQIPKTGCASSRSFRFSALLRGAPKAPKASKAKLPPFRTPKAAAAPFPRAPAPKPYMPRTESPPPPKPPKRPKPDGKQTLSALFEQRKYAFVGLAVAAGLWGAYISYLAVVFFFSPPPPQPCCEPQSPTGLPATLTRATAAEFDASLDWPERLMGLTRVRRRLAALAHGHVLEVAVGTGRNLAFYDWDDVAAEAQAEERRRLRGMDKARYGPGEQRGGGRAGDPAMTTFTGVDLSGDVLEVARERARKVVPGGKKAWKRRRPEAYGTGHEDGKGRVQVLGAFGDKLRLIKSDAQQALPPPPSTSSSHLDQSQRPPAAKYDTVLQTFGICSVADPAQLLANLASAVQPGTGRILLLEHGRGLWAPINNWLDRYADRHFERFGCWWNRDVEGIVRAAAAEVPGLEVVEIRRVGVLQFGTTLWIELKMN